MQRFSIDRDHVLKALTQYDQLGRESFLSTYGFGKSTRRFLQHEGQHYDVKAVAAAAFHMAHPDAPLLKPSDFSSNTSLAKLFRRLGFEIIDQPEQAAIRHATTLRDALETILSCYLSSREQLPSKRAHAWIAVEQAAQALRAVIADESHFQVRTSLSKQAWEEVPWISVLDQRTEPSSAQIAFLFRADMSGVYLVLQQQVEDLTTQFGWPRAQHQLRQRARELRRLVAERLKPTFVSNDAIDLCSSNALQRELETSILCWRLYGRGAFPEPASLVADLFQLVEAYEELLTTGHAWTDRDITQRLIPHDTRQLTEALSQRAYGFLPWQVASFVHAVRTKPLVILAGISGTGKTKLPVLVAELTGAKVELVPVRPDWTDSSDLLGFTNLQGVFKPGQLLEVARRASQEPDVQYFFVLDEMNLARVEHYLAEVLSAIEDRVMHETGPRSRCPLVPSAPSPWNHVYLPPNLALIGTVNMDESTHGFSRKVLDRSMTIEMSEIDLAQWRPLERSVKRSRVQWPAQRWQPAALRPAELTPVDEGALAHIQRVIQVLSEVNRCLVHAQLQVGYRVRDEMVMFVLHASLDPAGFTEDGQPVDPLDLALVMKVLPRLQGSSQAIGMVLESLLAWVSGHDGEDPSEAANTMLEQWRLAQRRSGSLSVRFPKTARRLCVMWERLQREGFTSYWM